MHATGYLEARPRHPIALGAAVTLNLAAVFAMLAYTTEVIPRDSEGIPTIKVRPIPIDKPVERVKTDVPKQADPRPQPIQAPLDPIVTVDPIKPIEQSWPQFRADPMIGSGAGDTIVKPQPVAVETGAEVDRRFIRELQPPYPAALERAEIEGSVTVRVQVGTDGRITAVELVRADDPAFFAATRDQALKRWRFRPATRDGVPMVSWLTKTVVFKMPRN